MQIRPYDNQHLEAVVRLSLRAWEPVFASMEKTMPPGVYQTFYPKGWRISQQSAVEAVCADPDITVFVAEENGATAGFTALKIHPDDSMGEIYMIAVDPDFQGRGYGKALTEFAVGWFKEAGLSIAMVETGSDPGHGPARRTYESSGFNLLPVARYFKQL